MLALFRNDLPLTVLHGVSAPDLLVLDLDFCYVITAYLPPRGSCWAAWTDTDPEQRLREALAYCTAAGGKMVLLMGDLNARTASNSSLFQRSNRVSLDGVSDARGHRLLDWCSMYGLSVLNGTTAEGDSPGALTCYQERGASVVDYVVASAQHHSWFRDRALVVRRTHWHWSDHCQVVITITLPPEVLCPIREESLLGPVAPPLVDVSHLDELVSLAVQRAGSHSHTALYGWTSVRAQPRTVYLSSASVSIGGIDPRAVFACFWGPGHKGNEVMRVPGEQNEARAGIAAVVRVLQTTPPSQHLVIYSPSQYLVRIFVYGAPAYNARGWGCKNADLLQLGVGFLQRRTAGVEFRWLSPISDTPNGHALAARELGRAGLGDLHLRYWVLPVSQHPYLPQGVSREDTPGCGVPASAFPKVSCNLLPVNTSSRPGRLVTDADLSIVGHQEWPPSG